MRKIFLVILIILSAPVFAANKTPAYASQVELQALYKGLQKEITDTNKRQRQALQLALDKIQRNTQQEINLLEKQVRTLSEQTAKGMTALNQRIDALKPKTKDS